ncbi:hypothetical protein Tco_1274547 [Tanacetum coccineum]
MRHTVPESGDSSYFLIRVCLLNADELALALLNLKLAVVLSILRALRALLLPSIPNGRDWHWEQSFQLLFSSFSNSVFYLFKDRLLFQWRQFTLNLVRDERYSDDGSWWGSV